MDGFSIREAWSYGFRFVSEGAAVHFLILVLIGIAGPLAVQYLMIGMAIDAAASPMTSGPMMMQAVGAPVIVLALALSHVLQVGSYFACLRFGFSRGGSPVAAIAWGLAAGLIATLVVAVGYVVAIFGTQAIASPATLIFAIIIMLLPLIIVYSLFFISQAIFAAATLILTMIITLVIAPQSLSYAYGGGLTVIIMLVMSALLFWLSARFSCVTPLMAERENVNVFAAIGESWRITSEEQGPITRYLMLVGFGVAIIVIAISFVVGASSGGLGQGRSGLGRDTTGELVLRFLFGIPIAFLSVMLPAGIYRRLVGEEAPTEVFD
jgi:hypothetical protein